MFEKIKTIIANHAEKDVNAVNENTLLVEELGLDSLDAVEIIMAIEDEFEVQVSDEAFTNVKTVGDVVYYFEQVLNK